MPNDTGVAESANSREVIKENQDKALNAFLEGVIYKIRRERQEKEVIVEVPPPVIMPTWKIPKNPKK